MNPETIKTTIQSVIDGFAPLAVQMQIPLEKLFEWAVRENYVIAITYIIVGIILGIATFYFIKFMKWGFIKREEGSSCSNFDDNIGTIMIAVFGGIILFIGLSIFLMDGMPEIIARLVNPEYHALLDLIKHAGQLVK